jgi:trigger factor
MALQIRSEMKELSPVQRELSIVVPGTEVARELERAYKELGSRVKMKGFRSGKIPRYVLEQYYKADTEQQVLERVVNTGFREAVKTHALEPVANPEIKTGGELLPGMDFSFSAKVEVKPAIEIKEYKGLKLTRTKYAVTDADIEKELTGLRERQAKVAAVEGRDTAQQGDIVETNWSGTVEGEHVKGLSGLSYAIEIGGGVFPYKDAEQALVGKKVGETFTVTVTVAADFRVESARGKEAVLTFNVLGLKQKTLPALDDEFAKDVAEDINTLDELRAKIRADLDKVAERRTQGSQNDAVVDALIEKNPFSVPEALVDRTAENLVVERLQQLPQQQAEMIWQSQSQRLKDDARPKALRQVRISLILEELVKKEGVEVTDADLEAHFEKIATDLGTSVKSVKQVYKKGRRADELKSQIGAQRILDKVIEAASWDEQTKGIYA